MTPAIIYMLGGVVMFCFATAGFALVGEVLRKILAVNLMGLGVFLVLVAQAARTPGAPTDPVPHAMVLTGIVVAVSATALALGLACRLWELTDQTNLDALDSEDH